MAQNQSREIRECTSTHLLASCHYCGVFVVMFLCLTVGHAGWTGCRLQELSDRLKEESARTAEAIGAADAARQQQNAVQAELAAAQAQARMVPGLQVGGR